MGKKSEKDDEQKGRGGRVEVTARGGLVVETTYDADGNVVEEITYFKRGQPLDPRAGGPAANVEKRPL